MKRWSGNVPRTRYAYYSPSNFVRWLVAMQSTFTMRSFDISITVARCISLPIHLFRLMLRPSKRLLLQVTKWQRRFNEWIRIEIYLKTKTQMMIRYFIRHSITEPFMIVCASKEDARKHFTSHDIPFDEEPSERNAFETMILVKYTAHHSTRRPEMSALIIKPFHYIIAIDV